MIIPFLRKSLLKAYYSNKSVIVVVKQLHFRGSTYAGARTLSVRVTHGVGVVVVPGGIVVMVVIKIGG